MTEIDEFSLEIIRKTRENQLAILNAHSQEDISRVPTGFSNNLIWNFAHSIVTMQLLVYGLSGVDVKMEKDFVDAYRKGSKPEGVSTKEEIEYWKEEAFNTIVQLEEDWNEGLFQNFKQYPTSYGIELSDVSEALKFNTAHEALHLGSMMAIRKALAQST